MVVEEAKSGGQLEQRVDCSVEAAEKIAQAYALVQISPVTEDKLKEALMVLAAIEKRCRVGFCGVGLDDGGVMIAGELSVVVVMGVVDGRSLGGRWIGVREGERVKAGWSVRLRQQLESVRWWRLYGSSTRPQN